MASLLFFDDVNLTPRMTSEGFFLSEFANALPLKQDSQDRPWVYLPERKTSSQ